ncbi:MAG: ubiquitin-activating E1 FCCH domain-containing protein [Alphaproteobacteria bacterium]
MPRVNDLRPALNAGELSPRMAARVDFNKYPAGAATVKNMIPLPQGGLMRRPGTRYVVPVKDESAKTRLLPFEFSTEQAYPVEAGNTYFRFIRNQGQITVADTDAAITNGTFDADIANWTDRSSGGTPAAKIAWNSTLSAMDLDRSGGGTAHAEQQVTNTSSTLNVLKFRVLGAPGDKIKLRIGTSSTGTEIVNDVEFAVGYHAYSFTATGADFYIQFIYDENTKIVQIDDVSLIDNAALELQTPYATADLSTLKFAQSADVMYIAHGAKNPIYKLTRTSHTNWSLVEVAWQDGPYLDENTTSTDFTPAATSGVGITITASATKGINDDEGFKSTDVGRLIRIQHGSNEHGWAVIVAFTDATHVDVDIKRNFNATTASTKWSLGAWSQTTGWPATVGFFEQRFAAARTKNQEQTFWMSQSADLENMRGDSFDTSTTVEDDDALFFTLAAKKVNAIQWVDSGQNFIIGTAGGEWIATSDGPVLTPTDVALKQHTTHGSADVEALRVGPATLFLQRSQRKIREFAFSFEVDGFRAPDLTILADHITRSKVTEITYQQEPDSLVWAVRTDGVLATMTYRRNQDVVGWARQVLGGSIGAGDAVVESITAIPGNDAAGQVRDSTERNEVWVIVKRTIDGATKRYIEFFEGAFEGPIRHDFATEAAWRAQLLLDQQDTYYSDSLLTLDDPKAIGGATQADPVVVTATAHGFSDGDTLRIARVVGMTELNGNAYTVANKAANTFELSGVDGTGFTAYASGGEARLEVTSVTGLGHVEGETVKVLADGKVHPDATVSGGAITLDYKASVVQVGLGYTHRFQSLKNVAGAAAGTGLGRVKRIHELVLVLLDAAAFRQGPGFDNLKDVEFLEADESMDTAIALFTGEKFIPFDGGYERDARIVIEGDAPLPFTVLAIAPSLKTQDGV